MYSVDTSSFIEPWNRLLPPDVLPVLWDVDLPALIASAHVRCTQEVKVELERQDDNLLAWAAGNDDLFVEVDDLVQTAVTNILAAHPKLIDPHSGRSGADPFVIAFAQVNNYAVVCEEKPRNLINPKIPDVCGALGVRCINMLALVREQGWIYR